MSLYAIIMGEKVDSIAIADAPLPIDGEWICIDNIDPKPSVNWSYKDGVFSPPVYVPLVLPNIVSKAAFRFRFTDAEYTSILQSAKTDVAVQAWVETFNMVTKIDLDNQHTKDGVAVLVGAGLLTETRANEILTNPVQPDERPA